MTENKRIKCIYCKKEIKINNFAGISKEGFICNNIKCLRKLAEEEFRSSRIK